MSRTADDSEPTLSVMSTRIRNGWRFAARFTVGSWPVRPLLTGAFFSLIEQSSLVALVTQGDSSTPLRTVMAGVPWSVLAGVLLGACLWVVNRMLRGSADSAAPNATSWRERIRYLLILILASVMLALIYQVTGLPISLSVQFLISRAFMVALLVAATFGATGDRLTQQVWLTKQALDLVANQRQQLLEADEKARQEVATYLHDSVQADLVVLSMQFRSLATTMPTDLAEPVRSLVDEMEALRVLDIRSASRRLSPDLAALGLGGTLRELATGYQSSMNIALTCSASAAARSDDIALGVYRIVEQALLNAAVHARASEVSVFIAERTPDHLGGELGVDVDTVDVTVTNDGTPMPSTWVRGAGSAVIEAWVSRFDGSWGIDSLDTRTRLHATLRAIR